jgi:hypothetical protein
MVPALPRDCALAAVPAKIINENNKNRLNAIAYPSSDCWINENAWHPDG